MASLLCALRRARTRQSASRRGQGVHDLRDMVINRLGSDEIFFAKRRFYFSALKVAAGTILLQSTNSAGMASAGVTLGNLVNRQSVFAVVEGRVRARWGGGHYC